MGRITSQDKDWSKGTKIQESERLRQDQITTLEKKVF